jgi:presenilin-like A22 family membrane protease
LPQAELVKRNDAVSSEPLKTASPFREPVNREDRAMAAMGFTFIFALLLAILVVPLYPKEYRAFGEDTNNPGFPLLYLVLILVFTGVILYIARKGLEKLIQWMILLTMWTTMGYVLYPVFFNFIPYTYPFAFMIGTAVFDLSFTIAITIATAVTIALYVYPEWYIINASGIMVATGVAAILGMSLSILPTMVLLIALAVYDAIAVYKTKHMVSLADSVTELHLPVVLVMPKDKGYSYLDQKGIKKELDSGKERDAMFMGLGDIVIPGTLVVSALVFLSSSKVILGIPGNLIVSLCTLAGGFCGFMALMQYVRKGRPQAGLPLLNSGVIIGYLISYYLVYRNLTFGISLSW